MSTKPWRTSRSPVAVVAMPARFAAVALLAAPSGCASVAQGSGHSFAEVRFARLPPPPGPAPASAPRTMSVEGVAPVAAIASAATTPAIAAARVDRLLGGEGFTVETRDDGPTRLLLATRMGAPEALRGEAVCTLEAMRRPDLSASDLTVRLTPAATRLTVTATARFVLVDANLLSGELSRQTCRSNGALEGAVRRAAVG